MAEHAFMSSATGKIEAEGLDQLKRSAGSQGVSGFDENMYLVRNPDVAEAVADGRFISGWDHYQRFGKKEGRFASANLSGQEAAQHYWSERQHSVYMQHIMALASFIGRDAKSIIDVGSNGCPYLSWFPWIDSRTSIDLNKPFAADGITSIKMNLFEYEPDSSFDLCLCLQVLEHIPDAQAFARKLLSLSPKVLISVPYRWPISPQTAAMGHIHDPVDDDKIVSWFGREPDFRLISTEASPPVRRMICYFEQ